MVEIANHPLLGNELVLRGGTCLHKLWLDRPWRYSEDLDYVRRSGGGVGDVLDGLREVAEKAGFDRVRTTIGRHPKVRCDSMFVGGGPMRVKVELNTFERSPALPTVTRELAAYSTWFTGSAQVPTFALEELAATKIRALFQRKKGRDLFDLWLAVERAGIAPTAIAASFHPYWPKGWTVSRALANLAAKLDDRTFRTDIEVLVVDWPDGYSIEAAAETANAVLAAIDSRAGRAR